MPVYMVQSTHHGGAGTIDDIMKVCHQASDSCVQVLVQSLAHLGGPRAKLSIHLAVCLCVVAIVHVSVAHAAQQ